MINSN